MSLAASAFLVALGSFFISALVGLAQVRLGRRQTQLQEDQAAIERQLAERQLQDYEALETAATRADIRAEYDRHDTRVYITNWGPADAFEVNLTATDAAGTDILIDEGAVAALPYERIRAGDRRQIVGRFAMGMEAPVRIAVSWRDESGPRRETFEQDPW